MVTVPDANINGTLPNVWISINIGTPAMYRCVYMYINVMAHLTGSYQYITSVPTVSHQYPTIVPPVSHHIHQHATSIPTVSHQYFTWTPPVSHQHPTRIPPVSHQYPTDIPLLSHPVATGGFPDTSISETLPYVMPLYIYNIFCLSIKQWRKSVFYVALIENRFQNYRKIFCWNGKTTKMTFSFIFENNHFLQKYYIKLCSL